MKFYFAQVYYSHHGTNAGSFFLTKYDAAAFVIGYLAAGMEEWDLPTEDGILAMNDKCSLYTRAGTTIARGEIDRVSFHIVEMKPGEVIDFNV